MAIFEPIPSTILPLVPAPILLSVQSDMNVDGQFHPTWLVVAGTEVLVLTEPREDLPVQVIRTLPLSSITGARAEGLVGGGQLWAETKDGAVLLLPYSASLSRKFGATAKILGTLAKGETPVPPDEADLPRTCPTCARPLLEGTRTCPHCVDRGRIINRLLKYARPYRVQMGVAILLLIGATLLDLVPAYLTKRLVDDALVNPGAATLLLILVGLMALARILLSAKQMLRGYLGVWVGARMMGGIRKDIYETLHTLSLGFFDKRQTSQLIGRVNNDAEQMRRFLTDGILWMGGMLLQLVAICFVLLQLDWKLALLVMIPAPIMLGGSVLIWPRMRLLWTRQWRSIMRINGLTGDTLQGMRVVKAFGQEDREKVRYGQANDDLVVQNIRTDGAWQGVFPVFGFLASLGGILVWYFGGRQVQAGEMTLGTLMAFIGYLGMLFGPLQWFSQAANWASTALAAADRVFELLDTPPEVADSRHAAALPRINGSVVFEDVTFGYHTHRPVLKNINLDVQPGEMIGLVGHSGAGKSTLINLLCRFYDVTEGRLLIDGVDIRKIRQTDLRQQIGVVLQETYLFDGSIAENIAYAKPDATPLEIMKAAKVANAHDFIVRLPDGYDTIVGERGHRLSGGEKQRVAIARAILHDPRILILDEATASVDTETERQIQDAISRLIKGRTTFAIAHRLSTLRNADRLFVLDQGKQAELGTHDELLSIEDGVYSKLVKAQRELSAIKGVEG